MKKSHNVAPFTLPCMIFFLLEIKCRRIHLSTSDFNEKFTEVYILDKIFLDIF